MTPETEALIAEARQQAKIVRDAGDCTIDHFRPSELLDELVAALEAAEQEKESLDAQCGINWEAKAYAEAALALETRRKVTPKENWIAAFWPPGSPYYVPPAASTEAWNAAARGMFYRNVLPGGGGCFICHTEQRVAERRTVENMLRNTEWWGGGRRHADRRGP